MIRNSLICKLINFQASMKENNENKILDEQEISKLIKAFPKDMGLVHMRFRNIKPVPKTVMKDNRFLVEDECCMAVWPLNAL